jgi:polysaccharide biosynthesis/export protein
MPSCGRIWALALGVSLGLSALALQARPVAASPVAAAPQAAAAGADAPNRPPLLILGPGDEVSMHVFGQPSMDGDTYVADDGTLQVPLAGPVHVAGLSPSQAASAVAAALQKGQFLINPHVTLTIVRSRSQQASVLGQVHAPGVYAVASNTTLLDLLAKAGGETDEGADTVYILRAGPDGAERRLRVNLRDLAVPGAPPAAADITMRGGDQVFVPRAPVFFIVGEVHEPGRFRLEADTTVLEAIARAGGVTDMGSTHRVVIKREESDGRYRQISARLTDEVQPNDVINVRERIF